MSWIGVSRASSVLRVREKGATRELDAIAAARRRLPMVELTLAGVAHSGIVEIPPRRDLELQGSERDRPRPVLGPRLSDCHRTPARRHVADDADDANVA